MMITPYLLFYGQCKDALKFYQAAFHSDDPKIMNYGDYMPDGSETPQELLRDWVMHGEMSICGTNAWFADEAVPRKVGNNVELSVTVPSAAEAVSIFDALKEDGEVSLPPTETFYSVFHAGVTDKFGVHWNVIAEEAPSRP